MLRTAMFSVAMLCLLAASAGARTGFSFVLRGASQLPPVTTNATGSGTATLSDVGDTLSISFLFAGLEGDYTMSHVHGPGDSTQSSGLRFTFAPHVTNNLRGGTCDTMWVLQPDEHTWLANGLLYINVHSAFAPNGEIRGQLLGDATPVRRSSFARIKSLYR